MVCHHRPWTANTVKQRRAWHPITSFGQQTRSNNIGREMPSLLLDFTFGQTTSGEACHHRFKAAQTLERRRARHDLTALGMHARSKNVRRGMMSPPFESTHNRTTSGVACHKRVWTAQTVERRRAWHAIMAFGQHKRSNDVRRGMKSPPLDCMHGRTMSDVA